jgi:hypothetical protein
MRERERERVFLCQANSHAGVNSTHHALTQLITPKDSANIGDCTEIQLGV